MLDATGESEEFTTTVVVAVAEHPLASVTVTVYVPVIAIVAFALVGFCEALTNALGPLHEYKVPPPAFN